jgi:lipopolysaccharide biosynthesis protein
MRRVALFAHFDAEARVRPYILFHLEQLRDLGAETVFVSNAALPDAEVARVRPFVRSVHLRDNTGMDFGMWRHALEGLDLAEWDEVILTNSSIIGPLFPLAPTFERMAQAPVDFWGMTESGELCRHIQSYFMVFRPEVFRSEAFRTFWDAVLPYKNRANVIFAYEFGLSRYLDEQGFRGGLAFPSVDRAPRPFQNLFYRGNLSRRVSRRCNLTLRFPDLLLDLGMPYLKVALFRENPEKLPLARLSRELAGRGIDLTLLDDI